MSSLEISIVDDLGTETLDSTGALGGDRFLDSTREVNLSARLTWTEGSRVSVGLHFRQEMPMLATLSIRATGDNARSLVVGLYDGMSKIVRTTTTSNKWLHPPLGLQTSLFLGLAVCVVTSVVALTKGDWNRNSTAASVGLLAWVLYHMLGQLRPYIVFDCGRSDRNDKWADWLLKGVCGALIFGYCFKELISAIAKR